MKAASDNDALQISGRLRGTMDDVPEKYHRVIRDWAEYLHGLYSSISTDRFEECTASAFAPISDEHRDLKEAGLRLVMRTPK